MTQISNELAQRMGPRLMLGFMGKTLAKQKILQQALESGWIGGVILFRENLTKPGQGNIESPKQLRELIRQIRDCQPHIRIAIDQEGGKVQRLKADQGFLELPSHRELTRCSDREGLLREAAQQLKDLGIDLNFAPVVDLAINPTNPIIAAKGRAFSDNPDDVAGYAAEWISAFRKEGVMSCLKHFPGHGSSKGDTHLDLVDISETWTPRELVPYQQLIEQKIVESVMVAHVFCQQLDPLYPASLSEKVVKGLLRDRLGFSGLVFSDDLQMGAIARHYKLPEVLERSLRAGVDVLVFGNNLQYQEDLIHYLYRELEPLAAKYEQLIF